MSRRLELQADGRWLLREGGRVFVVPETLGRRLAEGGAEPELEAALAVRPDDGPTTRTFLLRRELLPAGLVGRLADATRGLAGWPTLALLFSAGVAGYAVGRPPGPLVVDPLVWLQAFGLALAAALIHETGHAAALVRAGGRPGGVGVGLLFILPVLYCDVTAAALLPRADRLRVDLAGLVWHLAAGGALAAWGGPACTLAAWGVLAAAAWNILPFLRTDGYWLLADALDVSSLEPFRLWRAAHLVFLALLGFGLTHRAAYLLEWANAQEPAVALLLRLGAALAGTVCLFGLVRRAVRLVRA